MPLGFISKIEKYNDRKILDQLYIDIYGKDGRVIKLKISEKDNSAGKKLLACLSVYAFPDNKQHLFAFEYAKHNKDLEEKYQGWKVYDIEKEFLRQGVNFENPLEPNPASNIKVYFENSLLL